MHMSPEAFKFSVITLIVLFVIILTLVIRLKFVTSKIDKYAELIELNKIRFEQGAEILKLSNDHLEDCLKIINKQNETIRKLRVEKAEKKDD